MPAKIIAIDGPAASGKGTLARRIAQALNFAYMDTGLLYRAVGYEVLKLEQNPEDEHVAMQGLASFKAHMNLDEPALRTDTTSNAAAKVAAIPQVRAALLSLQRDFANNPGELHEGAVLDGRDIGTVVCPDAQLKLFITAKDEIRAERRMKELQSKGIEVTKASVLEDLRARDARDSSRKTAPLQVSHDAVVIDTSDLNVEEAFEKAMISVRSTFL